MNAERWVARVGDRVCPDGWNGDGAPVTAGEGYCDAGFPGCEFRLLGHGTGINSAVNVKVTGRPHYARGGDYRCRCKVEFVGDCEPSTFGGGWIYRNINS